MTIEDDRRVATSVFEFVISTFCAIVTVITVRTVRSSKMKGTQNVDAGNELMKNQGATIRQTIVETLEAPRLVGIEVKDFVEFREKRHEYERKLAERNAEQNTNVPRTTIRNSIDNDLLKMFIRMQWIPETELSKITEESLITCINTQSSVPKKEYDVNYLDKQVSKLKMDLQVLGLKRRVCKLAYDYEKLLTMCGYDTFISAHPLLAVQHIYWRIYHDGLKTQAEALLRLNKEAYKTNYSLFLRDLCEQADKLDICDSKTNVKTTTSLDKRDSGTNGKWKRQNHAHRKYENTGNTYNRLTGSKRTHSDISKGTVMNQRKEPPPCLHPNCNESHFLKDCPLVKNNAERKKIFNEWRAGNRAKRAKLGLAKAMADIDATDEVRVSFLKGDIEAIAIADTGADASILPLAIYEKIMSSKLCISTQILPSTVFFSLADPNADPLPCSRKVVVSISIEVRHAAKLHLKNVSWYVADKNINHVILGNNVLKVLGMDSRSMLKAAMDRLGPEVDLSSTELPKSGKISALIRDRNDSLFYSKTPELGDESDEDFAGLDFGDDEWKEIRAVIETQIEKASANGLSKIGMERLWTEIERHKRIFRLRLGSGPPSKLPPMKINLKNGAVPVKVKARRYAPKHRDFINSYIEKLLQFGFLEERKNATWQSAPLLVLKPGKTDEYRMTIDLRPVNASTEKECWPLPHIDSEVADFDGSECFASIDFIAAYWQCMLDETSRDCAGIITPSKVVVSTRVLQGFTNAVAHFQRSVHPLFDDIRSNVKSYLDDLIAHASCEDELLDILERVFEICDENNLYLAAKKCRFFLKEITWCGRIISKSGYRVDPHRTEALVKMGPPKTADELCEFVHCLRWMSGVIPDFVNRIKPLNDMLESAFKISGKRTKRSLKKVTIAQLSWGDIHEKSFNNLKDSLRNSVELSYPKQGYTTHVITDASEFAWSGIVTQTPPGDSEKKFEDQNHEPLAFLGAEFRKSEKNWTTYEKEAFAIYSTFKRLDYILFTDIPVRVHTDHRNLLFIFAPRMIEPQLGRHIVGKVQRWALYISIFNYEIEHIPGDRNIFADLLTRWGRGYRKSSGLSICTLVLDSCQQLVPAAGDIIWPSLDEIREAQIEHTVEARNLNLQKNNEGLYIQNDVIWIPSMAVNLQLKLLVTSHCGMSGHRGIEATQHILREQFTWKNIDSDVEGFVKGCLHCLVSRTGSKIPRPLSHQMHAMRPNEILHLDFLYMGSGKDDMKYVLIFKDDFSSYVWLFPAEAANADVAAESLCTWVASFGCPQWLISDQGSHFKNQVVRELSKELRTNHHFTTAYSPWANGTVERVCREVQRTCRALLSEWKLAPQDWPAVLEAIQSILNSSPLKKLGKDKSTNRWRTPHSVFTGQKTSRSLLRALPPSEYFSARNTSEVDTRRLLQIELLQDAVEKMHSSVLETVSNERKRAILAHNRRTNISVLNLHPGDFVLVRVPGTTAHKLSFKWTGPRRVLRSTGPHTYEIEDLISGKSEIIHDSRMILYRNDMVGKEVSEELLDSARHLESSYQVIRNLHDVRTMNGNVEIWVEWEGLPDNHDFTWEPLTQLYADVPEMVREFGINLPSDCCEKQKIHDMTAN